MALVPLAACQLQEARPEAQPSEPAIPAEPSAAVAPSVPGESSDGLVIPGERVGPVTAQTSRADLANFYGEAALSDRPISLGEGSTEVGTVVNSGTDQQFAVVWADAAQSRPRLIKDFGPAWQIPEGLGVGASYAAVQAVLGDFDLYGFAWDYGGTIVLEGTALAQYDNALWLRLAPSDGAIAAHLEAYEAMMGDEIFASSDPNLTMLAPSVYEMVVSFDVAP
ncbi:hypothetical protein [Phormidium tenue]|uniref:Uncharacterized protein n=1 Tax=Phormidium tenue NIES-30 TaxID=549789 RepID=A0A1U7J684_9CYAN|nr:hypothetical protein [Phormidium tenue]MBD2232039.1 hypothetical protein [Phormidium tenue FACHB-1052]OKH48370.1 hypothetical protein NIES30_10080 [Phormidium tenue NIES-30]